MWFFGLGLFSKWKIGGNFLNESEKLLRKNPFNRKTQLNWSTSSQVLNSNLRYLHIDLHSKMSLKLFILLSHMKIQFNIKLYNFQFIQIIAIRFYLLNLSTFYLLKIYLSKIQRFIYFPTRIFFFSFFSEKFSN